MTKIEIGTATITDDTAGGLELSGEVKAGNIHISGSEILSGSTTYFTLDPVDPDLIIGGDVVITNPVTIETATVLSDTGLEFSAVNTINIGSTVTTDGGETVNILQADTPKIILDPNGATIPELNGINLRDGEYAGQATLDASGLVTVTTNKVLSASKILLTLRATGVEPVPTGIIYISGITNGTDFQITSSAGAADVGVNVYWFIVNVV